MIEVSWNFVIKTVLYFDYKQCNEVLLSCLKNNNIYGLRLFLLFICLPFENYLPTFLNKEITFYFKIIKIKFCYYY